MKSHYVTLIFSFFGWSCWLCIIMSIPVWRWLWSCRIKRKRKGKRQSIIYFLFQYLLKSLRAAAWNPFFVPPYPRPFLFSLLNSWPMSYLNMSILVLTLAVIFIRNYIAPHCCSHRHFITQPSCLNHLIWSLEYL